MSALVRRSVIRCMLCARSTSSPGFKILSTRQIQPTDARSIIFLQTHKCFATAATSDAAETPKDNVVGEPEKKEFQAETRMLLDIVARSLYSDKEVFIRELISNASDALEKFRYLTVTGGVSMLHNDADRELNIKITTNKQDRIITFEDSGIGMTKQEIIDNLGTIARSGSKSFIKEIKDKGAQAAENIIGQFGVGFYSAFMVANKIEVYSRSSKAGSVGYKWFSDGTGTYELQQVEGVPVGTRIKVYLKTECREFSDDTRVKAIIKKYSNFIGSPIYLNGDKVNSIEPLWLMEPRDVTPEQHVEFYRFMSASYDKPRFTLHYKADAPISINALLYVPEGKPGLFELSRESDVGVALYSRKILIKSKAENILPKWLRFVKGVVDSEDIPLNLSRELLQNSSLIAKLRSVLSSRLLKYLNDKSQKDPLQYDQFYRDYSIFLKEGIVISQDRMEKENIAKLLRFESSNVEIGKKVSLEDYCSRQQDKNKPIYYLAAPSRELAETSPYFESLKRRDEEVLFCYDMYDELVLLELKEFSGRQLVSVENDSQDENRPKDMAVLDNMGLKPSELEVVLPFLKSTLSGKAFGVKVTTKLDTHPCVVMVAEMAAARHFIRTQAHAIPEENRYALLQPHLEINPRHAIIIKLHKLIQTDKELAEMVAGTLFTNAMVQAGLVLDARGLITHINQLLTKALEKH